MFGIAKYNEKKYIKKLNVKTWGMERGLNGLKPLIFFKIVNANPAFKVNLHSKRCPRKIALERKMFLAISASKKILQICSTYNILLPKRLIFSQNYIFDIIIS